MIQHRPPSFSKSKGRHCIANRARCDPAVRLRLVRGLHIIPTMPKKETAWRILHPAHASARRRACAPHTYNLRDAGTAPGVNISPGCDDDGWTVPQPVRLADGTRVQLYKDGEALHAAYEALRHAKKRICLEVYIFADDATGRAFAELLCEKALQGVRVYVIYDSIGSHGVSALWCRKSPIFEKMRRSGVRLAEFHPVRPWEGRFGWRPVNRDHRKLLVIDDDISGLGGLNVGREYAGSWVADSGGDECDLWRDNAMGIVGPASRLLLQAFAQTWKYVHTGGRIQRAEFHRPLGDGDFGLLASVPSMNSPLAQRLRDLLKNARQSIELTMAYFAPPDELIEVLCKAAKR